MNKYNKFISRKNTGRINAGIDFFSRAIKSIAIYDEMGIEICIFNNAIKELLEIRADYEEFTGNVIVTYDMILKNIYNPSKFAQYIYDKIKQTFIEYFEEIENNQEHEVDEHWEFVDIGSM